MPLIFDTALDQRAPFQRPASEEKAPQETFIARNSILAEYGVVGFELGYSYPPRVEDVYV